MSATAKVYQYGKAPKHITLHGDKTKKAESAQHIIEFPGGAIELTRTTDNNYWAHIIVYRGDVLDDAEGLVSANGKIIGSRIDRDSGVDDIEDAHTISQVALLIKSV